MNQRAQDFDRHGYVVVPHLISEDDVADARAAAARIVAAFEPAAHPTVFRTDDRDRGRDEYFMASAEAIHCFVEADAINDAGELNVPKATAINNDGNRKVGFLAPSVDGHADVVKEALSLAELSARDITLVDAHGTGTAVGDPIEVAALTEAFRDTTDESGFCRLTSTKPNIGHLDTAAGVAADRGHPVEQGRRAHDLVGE